MQDVADSPELKLVPYKPAKFRILNVLHAGLLEYLRGLVSPILEHRGGLVERPLNLVLSYLLLLYITRNEQGWYLHIGRGCYLGLT